MTGNLRKAKEFQAHVPSLGAFALVMMTVLMAQGNLQAQTPRPGPCADARTMVGVGVRDVMAGYLEAGVRCPITPPLTLLLGWRYTARSEEHTSELQSQSNLVCRLLLETKNKCVLLHMLHNRTDGL